MVSNIALSRIVFFTILTSLILVTGLKRNQLRGFSGYNPEHVTLLSDFQSEIGCASDFDPSCSLTRFSLDNAIWTLRLNVPAGKWKLFVNENGNQFGQHGRENSPPMVLFIDRPGEINFQYDKFSHQLKIFRQPLESRSLPAPNMITLDDTLIYDHNGNMIANPADSIRYTMILKNQSGSAMSGVNITHSGDPNTTYDPNSLKASPLAFNDTIRYNAHPKSIAAPGLLLNDFDLNDPLPNPPFYTNLSIIRVNGWSANVGSVVTTAGGGTATVNANGSLTYDSTGVHGALTDMFTYTVLDQEGFSDSATVLIQFNMPPVIASNIPATDSICAYEQRDTFIMPLSFTIMDDGTTISGAKIQICNNYLPGEDTLIAFMLPMGITSSWVDGSGTLMLMGSTTLAAYETAIESVQYTNQSDNPDMTPRTICITVNDGSANSNEVTRILKIKPINDCPTAVRDTFYLTENDNFPLSNVLDNDTDPENNPLTASGLANFPINGGMVSLGGNGFFAFFPTMGATGLDTLNEGDMFFARVQYNITDLTCTDADSVIIKMTGVNDAPVADSNKYSLTQTSTLTLSAPGILADDDDIDHGSTLMVGEVNGSAANVGGLVTLASGAELTVMANGSFTYNPKCLVAGLDSFTYAAKDEHNALSNSVKVYLQINQTMWFVDDVVTNGSGSFNSPFNSLASVESQSQPGDYIFLFPGVYNQNLLLKNNQKLYGAAENWICPSGSTIRTATDVTTFQGELTLAMNDTIKGISFSINGPGPLTTLESRSSSGSVFIKDNNASVGNLTMVNNQMSINNFARCGMVIKNGGTLNVTFDVFDSNTQTALDLNNCNGNIVLTSGGFLFAGDTIINIKGGQLSATFNNSMNQSSNFPLLTVTDHSVGTLTFQTGILLISNGSGLQFNNADGTYNFNSSASLNGGDAGIDIINGSGGNFSFANASISNPTGIAFLINGGNGTISHNGTILKSNAGRLIDIQARSGGSVTFNGNLACTMASTGINVSSCTGGTVSFAGSVKTFNTPGNNPVNLSSNTGATINFTNGGMAITSSSATGFNATGGGTVSVQGTANTITSTTGNALNVNNTDIGSSNLNFQSISSNGSSNGIILSNTGTSGGLIITGDGGIANNSSGGTIQNTTGAGISLTNTRNVMLDQMNIQSTVGSGIKGTAVVGFTCTNSTINNSATGGGVDESNIAFNSNAAGTEQNLSGTVMITGNTLTNAVYHGIDIMNFNGTINNITISNNTITSTTSITTSKGSGMRVQALGSASTVANITKASVTSNTITNFPSGNGILFQGGNGNAAGTGATLGTPGSLTDIISISGNRIAGQSSANLLGSNGIVTAVSGKGQGNFDISNNGTVANPITNVAGSGVACSAFGQVTVTAVINNNVIVAHNIVASRGIAAGVDMVFGVSDAPSMTLTISNNNVSQCDGNGIFTGALNSNGMARIKILNNTIAAPLTGNREGIRVNSGTPSATGTNTTVCLNISGNTSAGSGIATGIGLRKEGTVSSTNTFGINGMAATATPGVESYVDGLNPAGNGTSLVSATSGFTNCSFP
jgi:hypothetical protein